MFRKILKSEFIVLILFFSFATLVEAGAFHIKNCTQARAFVCAYNSDDSSLAMAAVAHGVRPNDQQKFKCRTNRCKAFIGFSRKDVGAILGRDIALGTGAGLVGATPVAGGVYLGEMMAEGALATGGGAAIAGGAVIGIVAAAVVIDVGVETNAVCKKIIKQVKKSKAAKSIRESKLSGHHTLSILSENNNPYLSVASGSTCPAN